MIIIKRAIALVVLVPAIVGLLVAMGGVVGSWALNNAITQVGVGVLSAGADFVGVTLETGSRVETLLTNAQTLVTEVDSEIERVGPEFSQNNDILDGIAELLDTDLETIVSDANTFFGSIQRTALALADALDSVRSLPLVANDTETVDQNVFRDVATGMDALSGEIDRIIDVVRRAQENVTTGLITELTTATTQLSTRIAGLIAQINPINAELTTLQTSLLDAQADWTRLIDMISIILTILFVFIALAFLSLALHAWAYFVRPDHTLRSLIPLERRETG